MAIPVVTDIRAFQLQSLRFSSEWFFCMWLLVARLMRQARSCWRFARLSVLDLRLTSLVKLSLKSAGTSEDPLH